MTTEFNPVEQAKQSKTFCITPWIHQYVGPAGDVKPCCVFEHTAEIGNLKDNTLSEVWNNEATKDLRLKFLNGETDDRCYRCNLYEDELSPKEGFNKTFLYNNVYKENSAVTKQILEWNISTDLTSASPVTQIPCANPKPSWVLTTIRGSSIVTVCAVF